MFKVSNTFHVYSGEASISKTGAQNNASGVDSMVSMQKAVPTTLQYVPMNLE